jgi:hypothetical protein
MEENDMLFKLKEMEFAAEIAQKIGEITVHGNSSVMTQLQGILGTKG